MKKSLFASLMILFASACKEKPEEIPTYTLYVGTYTRGASEGIYTYTFDAAKGKLSDQKLVAKLPNPSYLSVSKDKQHLYAVQETTDFDSLGGGITAFKINDGELEFQKSLGTQGDNPCHVSLSDKGFLAVSNHGGGSVAIFKLNGDGLFEEGEPQIIDHKVLDTVKRAHAHMAQFIGNELFVADFGLDAIKRYRLEDKLFVPGEQATIGLDDKAGPRHFTFGSHGKILYVINETGSTIVAFEKDPQGNYQEIQAVKTIDDNYQGGNACADIHLSPDGKFLYGSNRGENTIVIFSVDAGSGKLQLVGRESVQGNWPRNFTIDPTGKYLLVANERSDNITIFERDVQTGTLTYLNETQLPAPVCLVFED